MKVNFSDTKGGDFDPLPSGNYRVRVTDGEIRESGPNSKNPGSQYVNWELTVQDGQFENRRLFTNTSLLPHALFALKGLLAATGKYQTNDLDSDDFEFEIDDVIGSEVIAVVEQREYEGEMRNNVKRLKPYKGVAEASSSILP